MLLAIDQGTSATKACSSMPTGRSSLAPRPRRPVAPPTRLGRAVGGGDLGQRARGGGRLPGPARRRRRRRRRPEHAARVARAVGARSGDAVGPLLSWQDQRTAPHCARLRREGAGDRVRALSGLPVDPMFSAPKATWLLDAHDPDRAQPARRAVPGHGGFVAAEPTGGEHVIEAGNASRSCST